MKSFKKIRAASASLVLFPLFGFIALLAPLSPSVAHAMTPTLSLSATGIGDSVQINVTGDPNVSVLLSYLKAGSGSQLTFLGDTSSSGSYSTTVSSATYGIVSNTPVYVLTNGLGGPQSPTVSWPTVNSISSSQITLSQTGVVLPVGQSTSVTATNLTSGALYISNNSNPAIANVSLGGNTVLIAGNTYGSTTVTVCSVGNTTNCPSIYVTVQNSGAQALVFSQNNVTLAPGQNVPITVSGGNGLYTILNNSNASIVQASINGSTITISTTNTASSSSITVCSTDMSSCGIINVMASGVNSSTISFSQTSPSYSIGQNMTISIYGGASAAYYISSNSNPSIVQASIANGSTLTLYGVATGSATVTVCSSVGGCGILPVTVNYIANGGTLTLSQANLNITTGQTLSITVSGGTAPYNLPTASSNIFEAAISGNILSITGVGAGSAQIAVCSAAGGCTWLSVSVNGNGTIYNQPTYNNISANTATGFLTFSQSNPTVSIGQSTTVSVSGGANTSYSIAYNSNPSIVQASLNAGILTVSGMQNGYGIIVICDTMNNCGPVFMRVGVPAPAPIAAVPAAVSSASDDFQFTIPLVIGDTGNDVLELQKRLTFEGEYSGPINGRFGPLTQAAVERYQGLHGLEQLGNVGPSTRAKLNGQVG